MLLLPAVFLASLLGSLHCAGMCGGMVALCQGGTCTKSGWKSPYQLWPYHLGRLLAYVSLGAAFGALGGTLDLVVEARSIQPWITGIFATLVILWGVFSLLSALGARLPRFLKTPTTGGPFRRLFARVQGLSGRKRSLTIGLLSVLLPCGWLHAFLLVAAGTGSVALGAATLATFWLGTVPILSVVGLSLAGLGRRFAGQIPTVSALLVIAVGVSMLFFRMPGEALSAPPDLSGDRATVIAEIPNLEPTGACCDE